MSTAASLGCRPFYPGGGGRYVLSLNKAKKIELIYPIPPPPPRPPRRSCISRTYNGSWADVGDCLVDVVRFRTTVYNCVETCGPIRDILSGARGPHALLCYRNMLQHDTVAAAMALADSGCAADPAIRISLEACSHYGLTNPNWTPQLRLRPHPDVVASMTEPPADPNFGIGVSSISTPPAATSAAVDAEVVEAELGAGAEREGSDAGPGSMRSTDADMARDSLIAVLIAAVAFLSVQDSMVVKFPGPN